jgi:hypothetical protein
VAQVPFGTVARSGFTATAIVALLVGCTNEPSGPGGGGGYLEYRSALVVTGSVEDSRGEAIFDSVVRVTVYEYQAVCSNQPFGTPFEGRTNEIGQYSLNLTFDRDEFDACLTIQAIPPTGSGFQSAERDSIDVEISELSDGIDAVRFDFLLSDAPTALRRSTR